MSVCRICLKQTFAHVFGLSYGSPTLRAKLLTCVPSVNLQFLDEDYCLCAVCVRALNTAYELREMQMAAEADIKAAMADVEDYANIGKYVVEASRRRDKQMNSRIQVRADGILLNDIKEEEQLAAIATIDPSASAAIPVSTAAPIVQDALIMHPPSMKNEPLDGNPNQLRIYSVNDLGQEVIIPVSTIAAPHASGSEFVKPGAPITEEPLVIPHGKMCPICFRQYPNRTCLQSHVRSVHHTPGKIKVIKSGVFNRKMHLLSPDEIYAIHMEVAKKCERTRCEECSITLNCAHELHYHITGIHKGYKVNNINFNVHCDICSTSISHKYLKLHQKGHPIQVKAPPPEMAPPPREVKQETGGGATGEEEVVVSEENIWEYWQCPACKAMFRSDQYSIEDHMKVHKDQQVAN